MATSTRPMSPPLARSLRLHPDLEKAVGVEAKTDLARREGGKGRCVDPSEAMRFPSDRRQFLYIGILAL